MDILFLYFYYFLIILLFCLSYRAQCLLLDLHSGITPVGVQGTKWDAKDWTTSIMCRATRKKLSWAPLVCPQNKTKNASTSIEGNVSHDLDRRLGGTIVSSSFFISHCDASWKGRRTVMLKVPGSKNFEIIYPSTMFVMLGMCFK